MSAASIATCFAVAALAVAQPVAACRRAADELRGCSASVCDDPGLRLTVADGLVTLEARAAPVAAAVTAIAAPESRSLAAISYSPGSREGRATMTAEG